MTPEKRGNIPDESLLELEQDQDDRVLNSMKSLFYEEKFLKGLDFRSALLKYIGKEKHPDNSDNYWKICGDTNFIMSRVINHDTGIPLSQEETPGKPRLELAIALYDPNNDANVGDHTYIRYYTGNYDKEGKEIVYFIDPTYQSGIKNEKIKGDLVIKKYTTNTIDAKLAEDFSLYPPSHNEKYFLTKPFVENDKDTGDRRLLSDFTNAINTDRITEPKYFIGISGKRRDHLGAGWTERIVWFIKMCRPEWEGLIYPENYTETKRKPGEMIVYQNPLGRN